MKQALVNTLLIIIPETSCKLPLPLSVAIFDYSKDGKHREEAKQLATPLLLNAQSMQSHVHLTNSLSLSHTHTHLLSLRDILSTRTHTDSMWKGRY